MTSQKQLAEKIGVSQQFMSQFFLRRRTLSWKRAKHAALITGTKPEWWCDGEIEKIKAALISNKSQAE